jgi:diguanylate cyclase (GGDEF)-like protein
LYVNIDTTYGEINQLYRISQEFVAAMSQEETVQKISESISQALGELIPRLDGCLIYAHSAEANEYILINPDPDKEAPAIVIPGRGLLGRAAADATGMVVNDITLEDALSAEERKWPAKTAILAHPMLAERQNAGMLVLMRQGKGFTAEEFRLVSIVANQAGVTLHNAQLYEQSRQMADIDRQLGILNQAAFTQQSQRALGRAQIARKPVAVLLGDIDDFRNVNNTYGHQTGDRVLVGVAQLMKRVVNASGFVGRWGGEEFVVTLPNTNEQRALQIAHDIRKRVEEYVFEADDKAPVHATISIGVAIFPRDAADFISLHKQADRAAYLAKKTGKNRVCLYEDRKELIEMSAQEIQPSAVIHEPQQ